MKTLDAPLGLDDQRLFSICSDGSLEDGSY